MILHSKISDLNYTLNHFIPKKNFFEPFESFFKKRDFYHKVNFVANFEFEIKRIFDILGVKSKNCISTNFVQIELVDEKY